ncbi:MAG TPA: hypothetical protein VF763_00985 [Candidatus Limnocylindrales bacterium]
MIRSPYLDRVLIQARQQELRREADEARLARSVETVRPAAPQTRAPRRQALRLFVRLAPR